jgi:hypothetical protein
LPEDVYSSCFLKRSTAANNFLSSRDIPVLVTAAVTLRRNPTQMARPALGSEEEGAEDYLSVIKKLVCSAHALGLVLFRRACASTTDAHMCALPPPAFTVYDMQEEELQEEQAIREALEDSCTEEQVCLTR